MAVLYFLFEVLGALIFSGMCVGLLYIGTIALAFLLFENPNLGESRAEFMVTSIIVLTIIIFLIYHF